MEEQEANAPYLSAYLKERLPQIGLDYETYGPYVLGVESDITNEDDEPEEEVNEVVQLLQASSETHSDNQDIWDDLNKQIIEKMKQDALNVESKKQEELHMQQKQLEEKLSRAKLEQQQKEYEKQSTAAATSKTSSSMNDDAKRDLLNRFGYEKDDDGDDGGGGGKSKGKGKGGGGGDDDDKVMTNREVAAQVHLEKAKELRSKKTQTKKEEQQKTKENRLNKEKAKEERKKKTTKGERRR